MKAIIPAAGLGTRFLPVTKSQPKEMLPVVDKPIIQYVVEEAVAVGVEEVLLVTGRGKRAIEDHFDRSAELEQILKASDKADQLDLVRNISHLAELFYVRQKSPRGLGHAIGCGAPFISDESFYVLLGDVIVPGMDVLPRLYSVHERYQASVIAVERVEQEKVSRYGVIDGMEVEPGVFRLTGLVEKPDVDAAPSTLAVVGRYLLTPHIMRCLEQTTPGAGGEIQLTDALVNLLSEEEVYAIELPAGSSFDTGNVLSWLEANIALALDDVRYKSDILAIIKKVSKEGA